MNLRDIQRKFIPQTQFGTTSFDHRNYHPDAIIPQPPHQILRDGEVVSKLNGVSKACLRCNGERVVPMRMPGFTLYECLTCGHKWRDSYNKPGFTLRPSEWRDRRGHLGVLQGRIVV